MPRLLTHERLKKIKFIIFFQGDNHFSLLIEKIKPFIKIKISKKIKTTMKHQVIVIGGGIAGLTSCVELQELGIADFVLLEGADRLGGRINTMKFGKLFLFLLLVICF
jgi:heterodisulfide reductase subunit A-like polyferredoxin